MANFTVPLRRLSPRQPVITLIIHLDFDYNLISITLSSVKRGGSLTHSDGDCSFLTENFHLKTKKKNRRTITKQRLDKGAIFTLYLQKKKTPKKHIIDRTLLVLLAPLFSYVFPQQMSTMNILFVQLEEAPSEGAISLTFSGFSSARPLSRVIAALNDMMARRGKA